MSSPSIVAAPAGSGAGEESAAPAPALSKSALKKQQKKTRQADKKAARKEAEKARRRDDLDRRRREWEAQLAAAPSDEARATLLESRSALRADRMAARGKERGERAERLRRATEGGMKIVIDLEFDGLMRETEIHSLMQQITYCYSVNGRSTIPAHLWLTGCGGELAPWIQKIPGFNNWIIEKENISYIEVFENRKSSLVYLTADAETTLDDLDQTKIYVIGGLVDRNRYKGITLNKANDQRIQAAKLPIGDYMKMSSSQVLTVNQVFAIMIKFMETKDWGASFFHVIPPRKRDAEGNGKADGSVGNAEDTADGETDDNNLPGYEEDAVEEEENGCKEDEEENGCKEEEDGNADDHASKRQCLRSCENLKSGVDIGAPEENLASEVE